MQYINTICVPTARGLRIWMEGNKLQAAGWTGGTSYKITYRPESTTITLYKDVDGKRKVTASTRAGEPRPIIELRSKKNDEIFSEGDKLECEITETRIEIRRAK